MLSTALGVLPQPFPALNNRPAPARDEGIRVFPARGAEVEQDRKVRGVGVAFSVAEFEVERAG